VGIVTVCVAIDARGTAIKAVRGICIFVWFEEAHNKHWQQQQHLNVSGHVGFDFAAACLSSGQYACSVYLLSLTEYCLVDPASGFAGRSATSHTSSSTSSSSSSTVISPRERSSTGLKPKHIPLTPFATDASGSASRSSACNRAVAWWGPRVLAVAAADGSVSLVRLPESVNILGAAPIHFAAGENPSATVWDSYGLCLHAIAC
jgi:hypothetical protein